MYDPFLDTFNEPQSLQKPLVPSRSTTPAIPSQIEASLNPPSQQLEGNPQSPSVAALFDPLGGLTPTPRASQTSFPSGSVHRSPPDAANPPTKRRPAGLSISTPSNPPLPASADPLSDLLGTQHAQPSAVDKPKPKATRQFTTPPLFQPPQPTYMVLPRPPLSRHPSRSGSSHAHEPSDDFGGFISVPAASDPLSNSSTDVSTAVNLAPIATATASSSTERLTTNTNSWNEFATTAQQRHAQNSSRIMGEFAHIESSDGDFLGWLDEEGEPPKDDEERKKWLAERDQKLKNEEGPHSPPGTPAEGPPPTTRTPKKKIKRDDAPSDTVYASPESEITDTPLKDVEPTREKSTSRERKEGGGSVGSIGGFGSYFPATLPRRLTTLLSNPMPATASMSPTIRVPRSADRENLEGGHQKEGSDPDPKAVFALPGASSLENLSSMHPSSLHHPANMSKTRPVPDSFLTHNTPFATVKYIPPTGAPGYAGESGWDTGGFAADWEGDEGVVGDGEQKRHAQQLKVKRVLKLIGRREETAGVLTRALGDAIRLHLPALARLCTTWTLLYSLDQHGISLHTFYNLSGPSASSTNKVSGGRKGALVIVRDSMDGVFGAWIGEGIRMIGSGSGHYGGGDSFLWKTASIVPDPSQEAEDEPLPELTIYKWTGRNDYIALCEPDFMSLGGGDDGKTGLYLDSNLLDGSSAKSMTFDNDILCAEEEGDPDAISGMGVPRLEGRTAKFEVIGLEVWGLVAS